MMRRSAEMMGARGGRKGGGIFGGVMESTAKLINSNEIGVRFKWVQGNIVYKSCYHAVVSIYNVNVSVAEMLQAVRKQS